MYENETIIKLLKEIANDEIFDKRQRAIVRIAIRSAAAFMLYDVALKGNSIAEAKSEIDKMFPPELSYEQNTKKKIYYRTAHDTTEKICGYVIAEDRGDCYTITKQQYDMALKKRNVGGVADLIFESEKPVLIIGID